MTSDYTLRVAIAGAIDPECSGPLRRERERAAERWRCSTSRECGRER